MRGGAVLSEAEEEEEKFREAFGRRDKTVCMHASGWVIGWNEIRGECDPMRIPDEDVRI